MLGDVGLPHRTLGLPHRTLGLPHGPLGLPHRPLGMPHRPLGLPHGPLGMPHGPLGMPHGPHWSGAVEALSGLYLPVYFEPGKDPHHLGKLSSRAIQCTSHHLKLPGVPQAVASSNTHTHTSTTCTHIKHSLPHSQLPSLSLLFPPSLSSSLLHSQLPSLSLLFPPSLSTALPHSPLPSLSLLFPPSHLTESTSPKLRAPARSREHQPDL